VPIASIRRDGQTQHRTSINPRVVAEYAELMRAGDIFPPIRIWWDDADFWLSDGFQRVAAAEQAGFTEILAEVRRGSQDDAKWDSYAANSTHGMRRTAEETRRVIRLTLAHANATHLSNVELAKHLHLSEATLRRWRKKLSSSHDEDAVRVVKRGKSTYQLVTKQIGAAVRARHDKSVTTLRAGMATMKGRCSPKARRLLNIVDNWAFGGATDAECLDAIERLLRERTVPFFRTIP